MDLAIGADFDFTADREEETRSIPSVSEREVELRTRITASLNDAFNALSSFIIDDAAIDIEDITIVAPVRIAIRFSVDGTGIDRFLTISRD